jgi:trehalose synthase
VAVPRGSLEDQVPACGTEPVERIHGSAEQTRGMRVVHVSAAGATGRVPELLGALLPLAVDAGLEAEWRVLFGSPELHAVARQLHDGLQGAETAIDDEAFSAYLEACAGAAAELPPHDVLVLHDPGTLGVAREAPGRVVWHCHVDASRPEAPALQLATLLFEQCTALVFPDSSFAVPEVAADRVHAIAPGIDPLSPRNLELAPRLAGRVVRPLGVDLSRPFVCQAMRFDRWKDPHATLELFGAAKEELAGLQLVLAGALETQDAEGWRTVKEISDYASDRTDVHLLTSYEGVGNLELGALQLLARVAVERSVREGFGLVASEALWKGTPVLGGTDGGLPLQVRDGVDGYLAEDTGEAASRLVELVRDVGLAIDMGKAGRDRVRERFLVTRVLEDELALLASVMASDGATVESG